MNGARQADCLAREIKALQRGADATGIALVENQIEDMQDDVETLGWLPAGGNWKGTPEALMLCLARLMRCATVASGTRKALAISAVVKPPTAHNVSAIAEDEVRAG